MRKIILITNSFPFGIPESSFLRPEIKELEKNFEITIISRNKADELTTELSDKINVLRYDSKKDYKIITLLIRTLFSSCFKNEIKKLLTNHEFSFNNLIKSLKYYMRSLHFADFLRPVRANFDEPVILYTYWNDYSVMSLSMIKQDGDKIVSRAHRVDLYEDKDNGNYFPMKVLSNRKTDLIAFISENGKRYFDKHFSVDCEKEVYRLGADAHNFNDSKNDGFLSIYSLSYLNPVKRVDLIAKALSRIDDINIKWTHIGSGKQEAEVKKAVEDLLHDKKNITYNFTGAMENEKAMDFIAQSDFEVLINVSASEGVPVAMMEAMSFGIPVIATNVGGVCEIVRNEYNGLLIEDDENIIENAKNAICHFNGLNEAQKNEMKINAFETWDEKYNARENERRFAERLLNL